MINKLLITSFFLGAINLFSQEPDSSFTNNFQSLKTQINNQQQDIDNLYSELVKEYKTYRNVKSDLNQVTKIIKHQRLEIDSLTILVERTSEALVLANKKLTTKIQQTSEKADLRISALGSILEKTRLYWIMPILVLLVVAGLIYWLLSQRIQSNKTDVEKQINSTKRALGGKSFLLDKKLVELLETQIKLKDEKTQTSIVSSTSNAKIDHSLALKVADEIVRMQKNIARIDKNTKRIKPLEKGIERIQANFAAHGYEMVNLLQKEYEDRMNVDVINFIENEDYENGKKIITRIIRPQVNFKDVLIQRAQIEVTYNSKS